MTAERDAWRLGAFERAHTSLSARTLSAYSTDVRLFAEWVARMQVAEPESVTRTMVRRYVASLATREYARPSIARKAAALRRYFVCKLCPRGENSRFRASPGEIQCFSGLRPVKCMGFTGRSPKSRRF